MIDSAISVIGNPQIEFFCLLQEYGAVDQLIQCLLFDIEHFNHAIIQAGPESLTILDRADCCMRRYSATEMISSLTDGNFVCLLGAETAYAPEYKYDYDSKQDYFDHPTASLFPHHVEHSQPLFGLRFPGMHSDP
jgi:hypothetical protein